MTVANGKRFGENPRNELIHVTDVCSLRVKCCNQKTKLAIDKFNF